MIKIYQWRFIAKGVAYSWNTVEQDHFHYLLANEFFWKNDRDFVLEGRILNVESLEEVR